ncbi:hypothetical protein bsdtb5_11620 [Anaeromicropila herbilytica]|uniref:Uncharacterized protein n=1 Tax=Anaeromicropila herbilytica TaxID=2785025 RepID=A0A7R7EK05_9FIRM|nr:hypothetical protein bsdtb5_11620 [Anaeromicropila herbilytica]
MDNKGENSIIKLKLIRIYLIIYLIVDYCIFCLIINSKHSKFYMWRFKNEFEKSNEVFFKSK